MWLVNCKRCTAVALVVFSITTYISYSHLLSQPRYSDEEEQKLQESLKQVSSKLMTLKQRHSRLISRVEKIPGLCDVIYAEDQLVDYMGPTEEYENLSRRIYSNIKELWYYLHDQLRRTSIESLRPEQIKTILEEAADRKRSLLSDLEKQPALDGYETWRRHEAASVGDLVQRRLHYLQHPRDCHAAKKLVCEHPGESCSENRALTKLVVVHIRRTDKFYEAKFYDIDEYMSHVEDYYAQLELTRAVDQRRVYLATDDAEVLEKAIKKYPQYTFYGDYTRARMACKTRYSLSALAGLLVDLHMLTLCDYVVLTLSSNVGRMVYELMQSNRDASRKFYTLDHFYYFVRNTQHLRIAVMHHQSGFHDISFNIGDLIDVRYNYWNGTGYGFNTKSKIGGQFPWYKTAEYLVSYPFPEYKQVPVYTHSPTIPG